jgi:phosphoglycolate phosphatase
VGIARGGRSSRQLGVTAAESTMAGLHTASFHRRLLAAVFDFDGTLADTGIDFGLMRQQVRGLLEERGLWDEHTAAAPYVLEMVEAAVRRAAELGRSAEEVRAAAEAVLQAIELQACAAAKLQEGAAETLAQLKAAGFKTAVITRNCAAAVHQVLGRYPLPLDLILPREATPLVKPHPAHLQLALARLGVRPAQAALVGDHPTDMQCARRAGALAVGLARSSAAANDLRKAGAHYVVGTLPEVAALLLALREGGKRP